MTAILGFSCKDAIILASDSVATFRGVTMQMPDVQKVTSVHFPNGNYALVARAGALKTADYFQETFEMMTYEELIGKLEPA